MKKYFVSAVVYAFIGLSFAFTSDNHFRTTIENQVIELVNCKFGQCQAIAKSTEQQCKHCVSKKGDSFCWQHD